MGGAGSPRPKGAATLRKYLAPQEMAALVSALSKGLAKVDSTKLPSAHWVCWTHLMKHNPVRGSPWVTFSLLHSIFGLG